MQNVFHGLGCVSFPFSNKLTIVCPEKGSHLHYSYYQQVLLILKSQILQYHLFLAN